MNKAFIVGISGGSASGKSTFCSMLIKELSNFKIKEIHMDDYFKPESERPYSKAPVTGVMYMDDNHPNTMNLAGLRNDLIKYIESSQFDIIVIEGLLTLWDNEIYTKLDLRLFVDCQADERIVRRLRRNMEWGLAFDQISKTYLDLVRYRHDEFVEPSKWKADLILNGSNGSEQALKMIKEYIAISIKN